MNNGDIILLAIIAVMVLCLVYLAYVRWRGGDINIIVPRPPEEEEDVFAPGRAEEMATLPKQPRPRDGERGA